MAKKNIYNDFYWNQYGNTTLHTNYNYFRRNTLFQDVTAAMPVEEKKFEKDLERLQNREKSFYEMFGYDNYNEFKKWVSNCLLGPDGEIIAKFNNESVRENIIRDIVQDAESHQNLSKTKIILSVDSAEANKKLKEVTKVLSKVRGTSSKMRLNKKGQLVFEADPRIMKAILNRFTGTNFHITNLNSERLGAHLKNISDLGELNFSTNGQQLSQQELSSLVAYRPFPWGYRNSEIQEAWKNSDNHAIMEDELNKAIETIRHSIKMLANGGSQKMNQALIETLDDVVPYPFKPDKYYNIFFVGANYKNGLLGAFGEFGTALLINYLRHQGAKINLSRAEVIGQELGKQDVRFQDLGVQVKNYSIADSKAGAYTRKNIEVNQHPSELAQYFPDKQNFLGFMANYYFNENIQKSPYGNPRQTMDNVVSTIRGEYLGELLRLAVDDLQITGTITFYEIGGRYLVPASALLIYYRELKDKLKVYVKGPETPRYRVGEVTRDENGYWSKIGDGNGNVLWEPTADNLKAYDNLISKSISFVSEMNNDFNLAAYALY